MRGGSFCRSNQVTVLREEAGGVPIGCEDDDGRFDVSAIGIDGISSLVIICFDRCHGGFRWEIRVISTQHPLEELRHKFVRP